MANTNKPVVMGTDNLKESVDLSKNDTGINPSEPLVDFVDDKEDKLSEFKEYQIEVTKEFVGQKVGDKIIVSGNVANALKSKGLIKVLK